MNSSLPHVQHTVEYSILLPSGVQQERQFWNIGVGNDAKEINFFINDFLIILMKNG